jgi:hypothetical protein
MMASRIERENRAAVAIKEIAKPFGLSIAKMRGDCCVSTECAGDFQRQTYDFSIDGHGETGIMSSLPRKTFGAVELPCKEASHTLSGRFVI